VASVSVVAGGRTLVPGVRSVALAGLLARVPRMPSVTGREIGGVVVH
jgi:hypothetical protein